MVLSSALAETQVCHYRGVMGPRGSADSTEGNWRIRDQ